VLSSEFIRKFTQVAKGPDLDLAPAALLIAKLEYPRLDASHYLQQLDQMGLAVTQRLKALSSNSDVMQQIKTLNNYLFEEKGFSGNQEDYDNPRNSYLNEVLERRTGIPITLALVYIEVSRRAGVRVDGVNFPGRFLLRLPQHPDGNSQDHDDFIVDPFDGGAILSETACRKLLRKHVGEGEGTTFHQRLLMPASKQQVLVRILVNLKRIYIRMRSFPQAHAITELLLALTPSAMTELRDRGLLAYHLNDFSAALRDLESYLRFTSRGKPGDAKDNAEHAELLEHVKTLRWQVASLN